MSLDGIQLVIAPEVPRYQLPEDLPLPPAFRAEINEWARSFLGMRSVMPLGQVTYINGKAYASRETFEMIKERFVE